VGQGTGGQSVAREPRTVRVLKSTSFAVARLVSNAARIDATFTVASHTATSED
jgi:hypothetical protein